MNPSLSLNKADHELVIQKIAELILAGMSFDPEELIIIPTATVAQFTGLSPKSVQRKFPITEISKQKQGVLLKTLREYLAKNTRSPNP
ncbi:MAG: hypothetical protein ACK56K_03745 [Akkermansiaceae bacterium]|jgi:hypothetical protein